jgi:hypothetical protein
LISTACSLGAQKSKGIPQKLTGKDLSQHYLQKSRDQKAGAFVLMAGGLTLGILGGLGTINLDGKRNISTTYTLIGFGDRGRSGSITFDRKLAFGCGAIILDVPTVKKIIKAKKQYIAVKDELDELTQEYNRVKAALEARIRLTGDLKHLLSNVKENYQVDVIKGVELKQLENLLIHKELQDVKSKSNS